MITSPFFTYPFFFTFIRLTIGPVIMPLIIFRMLPSSSVSVHLLVFFVFAFFSFTDFLDGYLARRLQQVSKLGALLDPIADKFFCFATLIALLSIGKIHYVWVIFLIGRDFLIMALRGIALEKGFLIPVSYLGKIKTMLLMVYQGLLIIVPLQYSYGMFVVFSSGLLYATVLCSFLSAYFYCKHFLHAWHR